MIVIYDVPISQPTNDDEHGHDVPSASSHPGWNRAKFRIEMFHAGGNAYATVPMYSCAGTASKLIAHRSVII